MAKANVVTEVKKRIEDMKNKKAEELKAVRELKTKAETDREAADISLKAATAAMDLDAYESAREAKHKAQVAIDMYNNKYKQLEAQEYISEEESDKVIASLLAYEDTLTAEFKEELAGIIETATDLLTRYRTSIADTEETIRSWTTNIHANYRSMHTTYADGTNRSPQPVPVRTLSYFGCGEAAGLETFLKGMKQPNV